MVYLKLFSLFSVDQIQILIKNSILAMTDFLIQLAGSRRENLFIFKVAGLHAFCIP